MQAKEKNPQAQPSHPGLPPRVSGQTTAARATPSTTVGASHTWLLSTGKVASLDQRCVKVKGHVTASLHVEMIIFWIR